MLIAVDVDQYANILYVLCMRFLWKSLKHKMVLDCVIWLLVFDVLAYCIKDYNNLVLYENMEFFLIL